MSAGHENDTDVQVASVGHREHGTLPGSGLNVTPSQDMQLELLVVFRPQPARQVNVDSVHDAPTGQLAQLAPQYVHPSLNKLSLNPTAQV